MPQRLALLVATYLYEDAGLRQLAAPGNDAEALAAVFRDPAIADFDVTVLVNEPHHVVADAIGEFYHNRRRDDLALLYFTGHGLKDDQGRLYLAMTNTRRDRLLFTGLSAQQIDEAMDSCTSRQKVLVLDCCYSGAFPAGRAPKADSQVHTIEKFQGKGRVVLTASDSTQYSFEGNHVIGQGARSVFTRFLVEGLTTGEADLDGDGDISLDELYSYVYDRVVEEMPQQRPKKQENVEGRIIIARNIHWNLPAHIRHAIESPFVPDRLAVLEGLAHLHRIGNNLVRTEVINQTRRLIHDDNKAVSAAAMDLMGALNPEQARHDRVATSSTSAPVDNTTARNDQRQQEAWADQYTQAGTATEKQAPQRVRRETDEQARYKVDNWTANLGQLTRHQPFLAASVTLLIFLAIVVVILFTLREVTPSQAQPSAKPARPTAQPAPPAKEPPEIVHVGTHQEGALVYFSLSFKDANNDAEGFGFSGARGSGWGEETHPFSSPSYGRVSPGRVDYPFNLGCGTTSQAESDVEAWIYDNAGLQSSPVIIHLSCTAPPGAK